MNLNITTAVTNFVFIFQSSIRRTPNSGFSAELAVTLPVNLPAAN
jgi:hypothetical protein